MASNYTENYKLPLWEGGDSFVREEFNAANKTIDAALARVEGMASTAPVLLATAQLESEAHTLTMDVSHIDMSQYDELRLVVYCSGTYSGTMPCCMQVNGISTDMQYYYQSGTQSSSQENYMLIGYCNPQGSTDTLIDITLYHTPRLALSSQNLRCSNTSISGSQYWGGAPFCSIDTLDSLTVSYGTGSANFAAGSKMLLLGYKY